MTRSPPRRRPSATGSPARPRCSTSGAADADAFERPLPAATEVPVRERLRWEKELLGLYLSEHPMGEVAEQVGRFVNAYSGDLKDETLDGQRVVIGGIVTGIRTVITKRQEPMAIVTLEDLQGSIEVVVFPRLYETTRPLLARRGDPAHRRPGRPQGRGGLAARRPRRRLGRRRYARARGVRPGRGGGRPQRPQRVVPPDAGGGRTGTGDGRRDGAGRRAAGGLRVAATRGNRRSGAAARCDAPDPARRAGADLPRGAGRDRAQRRRRRRRRAGGARRGPRPDRRRRDGRRAGRGRPRGRPPRPVRGRGGQPTG